MSGESLDYTIVHKSKYDVVQGKIDSICQKHTEGCTVRANQQNCRLSLQLKLKNKAVIRTFEVKTLSINKITFELFGQKDLFHQQLDYCFSKRSQTTIVEVKQSFKRGKETTKIKIQVECLENTNGIISIGYLLVRGDKCREEIKNKSISRVLGENDQFFDAKISKHYKPGMPKPDIFSQRKRNNKVEKKQESEDSQIRKAIQISKKEAQANLKKQKQNRHQEKQLKPIEQLSNTYSHKEKDYPRIDYDKHKDIFKYVSPAWVQAQRAAEKERGVKESQKLSNAIVVRIFHSKTMCIDIPDKQKKARIQKSCDEMGARLKKEPEDHCLLITDRADTEKVAKARKLKGVKILRSDFVSQCRTCQAYLDEKEYFFK